MIREKHGCKKLDDIDTPIDAEIAAPVKETKKEKKSKK